MPNPVPGTVVPSGALVSPGGSQGAGGPMGPNGPTVVSADAGNIATLGSDNLILVPQSSIWSTRLRSFNAVGNPNFEVDQRNVGQAVSIAAGTMSSALGICDRWFFSKNAATATFQAARATGSGNKIPGTNFIISECNLNLTLGAVQSSLAAGEYIQLAQSVEGPMLRELIGDTHSLSILAYCSQAPFTFTVRITTDASPFYTLTKLCTITTAGQFTLFTLPNLPLWTPSGTWSLVPGTRGYTLGIGLGSGSTYTSPANDTWQAGNFICGPGSGNFAAFPVNTIFALGFVQHEPGPLCTQLIDKPFTQNYDECLRYYDKSYAYGTAPGTATSSNSTSFWQQNTTGFATATRFSKKMAKAPTVTIYNWNTGAANSVYFSGVTYAVSSVSNIGDAGFTSIVTATLPAVVAGATIASHYTADTGW